MQNPQDRYPDDDGGQRNPLTQFVQRVLGESRWIMLIVAVVITFILGTWGFAIYDTPDYPALHFPDNWYQTLLLFFFSSGNVNGPLPWQLEIARWIAPALLGWATISAILYFAKLEWLFFRMRWWNGFTVLVGRRHATEELAASADGPVVVVEHRSDAQGDTELLDDGGHVLRADLRTEAVWKKLRVGSARYVVLLDPDDEVNVSLTAQLGALLHKEPGRLVTCYTHVADPDLEYLLSEQELFRHADARFDARLFNLQANSARILFQRHAPDLVRPVHAHDPNPAHVLLVGLGSFGYHLLVHALRTGHYANDVPQRITIVDDDAAHARDRLFGAFETIAELADLRFVQQDASTLLTEDLDAMQADVPFSVAYVAAGSDVARLQLAMQLRSKLPGEVAVVACLRSGDGIPEALGEGHAFACYGRSIDVFILSDQMRDLHSIIRDDLDAVAAGVHQEYLEKYGSGSAAGVPWQGLSLEQKNSNRRQADHIDVKLRAIGCQALPADPARAPHAFTEEELEVMARMEHRRWMSDKILAGWVYGVPDDGRMQDPARKIHRALIPYDGLPRSEQEKDVNAVAFIPALLARSGRAVYKRDDA